LIRPVAHRNVPYFDHNATTPLLPAAREVLLQMLDEAWHNPSSPYRDAARVHRKLQDARARIAEVVRRAAEEVVFTSGATEANNAVINWARQRLGVSALFLVSPTEHPSVIESLDQVSVDYLRHLRMDAAGSPDVGHAEQLLAESETALVACMAANNETGVLGPVGEIAECCDRHDVPYLCDASQWIGRLPARDLPPSAFVVGCAHKFGGPKGVGFLCVPAAGRDFHGSRGGDQEHGLRAGTENLPAIAAMAAALEFAEGHSAEDCRQRTDWRDALINTITTAIPGSQVNGRDRDRLWNTVSLTLPRHENTRWVTRLDKLDFQVSTGSACATGSNAPSHVLAALKLSAEETRRTIRVSAGWETREEDWTALKGAILQVWRELESDSSSGTGEVISV